MLENELVGQIRGGMGRLVTAVGYHRAAWALGGITATNLRRFCEASPPKPISPPKRRAVRPAAAGATGELERFELLEPVRLLVRRGIETYGQRATARAIGGVSAPGIAKFAGSNARVYSGTWRRLLAWYDACVQAGTPAVDPEEMEVAITALVRDLAPDVAARTAGELRAIVEEAFRLNPVVMPLTETNSAAQRSRQRARPSEKRVPDPVPAATVVPPVSAVRVLPGRRPARFRAGRLLRPRALRK